MCFVIISKKLLKGRKENEKALITQMHFDWSEGWKDLGQPHKGNSEAYNPLFPIKFYCWSKFSSKFDDENLHCNFKIESIK